MTTQRIGRSPRCALGRAEMCHSGPCHDAVVHADRPWSTKGQLLVAVPDLEDPNFARTVVYMLAHDELGGALGLVLNRPGRLAAAAALANWAERAAEPALLFKGGPVETGGIIGLGVGDDGWPLPLDLSEEPNSVAEGAGKVRLFQGYAGWGPGQLEGELAMGGWIVAAAEPDDAFTAEPLDLWRTVLGRQSGAVGWLAHFPDDLSAN
jgi:putative transcriptional regulator